MKNKISKLLLLSMLGLLVGCDNPTATESSSEQVKPSEESESVIERPTNQPSEDTSPEDSTPSDSSDEPVEKPVITVPSAEKLNADQTIVVDGEYDEAWDYAYTFIMKNELDGKNPGVAPAEAKCMWTEEGLYFIATVYDNTIVDSDRVDFWITEKHNGAYQSSAMFVEDENAGEYAFGLRNDQTIRYLGGFDVSNTITMKVVPHGTYYVAEAFMPKKSEGNYAIGQYIGFETCTNHYEEGTGRLYCVPWANLGWYWENTTALYNLPLVDDYK